MELTGSDPNVKKFVPDHVDLTAKNIRMGDVSPLYYPIDG